MKELENESLAMELLKDYKKANKRLFIIILVILSMWFVSIGLFIYYINTTGYVETTEIADTNEGGDACVGGYIVDTWNCTDKKIEYIWKIS
jgi:hypothetical protein